MRDERARTLALDEIRIKWMDDNDRAHGCFAEADVSYRINENRDRRIETFQSGGLWGIEIVLDDADPYQAEVENEQLEDLRDHLQVFGVPVDDFNTIAKVARGKR